MSLGVGLPVARYDAVGTVKKGLRCLVCAPPCLLSITVRNNVDNSGFPIYHDSYNHPIAESWKLNFAIKL